MPPPFRRLSAAMKRACRDRPRRPFCVPFVGAQYTDNPLYPDAELTAYRYGVPAFPLPGFRPAVFGLIFAPAASSSFSQAESVGSALSLSARP